MEFSKINYKRTGNFAEKRFGETETTDQRHESSRPKHVRTEENVTTVGELVDLPSQEDQTQTHRSTRQISSETGLTQCTDHVFVIFYNAGVTSL